MADSPRPDEARTRAPRQREEPAGGAPMSKIYEFYVDGDVRELACETFPDMRIEEVGPGLILRGAVIDESHLCGIIAQLRTLGLSIVSAHPLPDLDAEP